MNHVTLHSLCALLLATSSAVPSQAEIRYRFRGLGCNPSTGCVTEIAAGINDLGQVTGSQGTGNQTFFWDPVSGWQTLSPTQCGRVGAADINNQGHIVGNSSVPMPTGGCSGQASLWTPQGGLLGLGSLPNSSQASYGLAINNLDQVAGYANYQNTEWHAIFWSAATGMIDIGKLPGGLNTSTAYGINDLGCVVGDTDSAAGVQAFVWTQSNGMLALGDLWGYYPPYVGSSAQDVNNLGEVVGYAYSPNGGRSGIEAFIWDAENGMRGLGILFNDWSQAFYINDCSEVTGLSFNYTGSGQNNRYGFIWDPKRGMRLLDALFDPCTSSSYSHFYPQGMNNKGQIVGYAWNFNQPVVLTPYVPGDLNDDNTVDLADLSLLLINYGTSSAGYSDGDLNCDHKVDLSDLGKLLSNFGETYP